MVSLEGKTIYVAGHRGLAGSALGRRLGALEGVRLVTAGRAEADLTDPRDVERLLLRTRPDIVIIAAGRVGGIRANAASPATFIYENLMIEANLIHGAWKAGVRTLLNFGSSCMYPRRCPQPMSPDLLMTGKLEPTSEPYSIAKLAGLVLCAAYNRQYGTRYLTAIPNTLYGPGEAFDPVNAHVISALIRRFHDAKARQEPSVTLWGTGAPRREFLYVEDLAEACELLLRRSDGADPVNIGSGRSSTIRELAGLIAGIVGFQGEIHWDPSQADGAPEKRLDSSLIRALGWAPRTTLEEGMARTYRWFLEHRAEVPVEAR